MRQGVLAGGNWIVDHIKKVDVWPQQDALANIISQSQGNGGSPFNVLVDLAQLGADFPLEGVGLVGQDSAGRWIREHCGKHHISVEQLQETDLRPTSYTDVMTVENTGRRTFFHQRGSNALLAPEHFRFEASRAKIFHLGYLLLLDRLDEMDEKSQTAAARVFKEARRAGLWTSVDLVSEDSDRFADILRGTLHEVDLCFMNEFEAGRSTSILLREGSRLRHDRFPEAAKKLLAMGIRQALVIHFPEGAYVFSRSGEIFCHGRVALPTSVIQGSAGAGDAFAAGFLMAWHNEQSWMDALRLGVCAAASSLTHLTCSDGVMRAADCLALGQKAGFQEFGKKEK